MNLMGKLLNKMQAAGVSFGGSAPSDEEKQKLRELGVEVYKKGGKVKKYAAGGSASKRADGCATRGKTRGRMV